MPATPPGEDFKAVALPLSFEGVRPMPRGGAPRLEDHQGRGFGGPQTRG